MVKDASVLTRAGADPDPGEGESLDDFARRYTERAVGWLIVIGVPMPDAEDLVQSALLALCACEGKVPPEHRLAWLRSTVLHLDWARRRCWCLSRKHLPRATWEMALDAALSNEPPETLLQREEIGELIERLFKRLKPERQEVVELYLLKEVPMAEVAALLNIKEKTAWSRWNRAKKDLRALVLAEREHEGFTAGGAFSLGVLIALCARGWARLQRGSGPLFAAAAVALVVTHHSATEASLGPSVPDAELAGIELASPSDYAFAPVLTAFAERERPVATAGARASMKAPPPRSASLRAAARQHLIRAGAALYNENDREKARRIIRWYEFAFPDNPFPEHYASIKAALKGP